MMNEFQAALVGLFAGVSATLVVILTLRGRIIELALTKHRVSLYLWMPGMYLLGLAAAREFAWAIGCWGLVSGVAMMVLSRRASEATPRVFVEAKGMAFSWKQRLLRAGWMQVALGSLVLVVTLLGG